MSTTVLYLSQSNSVSSPLHNLCSLLSLGLMEAAVENICYCALYIF